MATDANVTPSQAQFIIERMLDDKTITKRDLQRYKKEMDREITELEERLESLRGAAASRPARSAGKKSTSASKGKRSKSTKKKAKKGRKRSRKPASKQAKKSMAVQGRYISYLRRFKGKKKKNFQEMARSESREKAIEAMKKELGK